MIQNADQLFPGFSKLSREERFKRLIAMGALQAEDVAFLSRNGLDNINLAEKLIENAIGYFQLPLGVASNFKIDGKDYVIPLAVEETSIIAALSKSAKWIRENGKITTDMEGHCIIGQIQIARVQNFQNLLSSFEKNRLFLIEKANEDVAHNMVKRGGGVMDIELKALTRPDGDTMAVFYLSMDSCDAMGANIINQVLEYLKPLIENLSGEKVSMCILSNLNDRKLTRAEVEIHAVEETLGKSIEEASIFAETDPYRAATHNKGVMNGIDPILIATGNDWRAVEAGVHAYAARSGQYQAISTWRYRDGVLYGRLKAPIIVGTVGGVTALHPAAKIALRMMDIHSAEQLSRVIAAVGLVQNLGALRALCTEGIIQGHMKLHIDNLLLAAGVTPQEISPLKRALEGFLEKHKRVSLNNAEEMLAKIRANAVLS